MLEGVPISEIFCFIFDWAGVIGFGEEKLRGKMIMSLCHIKGTVHTNNMTSLLMLTLIIWQR